MLEKLRQLEKLGQPVKVGLIGAGAMGHGIAWQISRTPGWSLLSSPTIDEEVSRVAAADAGLEVSRVPTTDPGRVFVTGDPLAGIAAAPELGASVLVESSNSIAPAARYCLAGFDAGMHAVLMNAEVDLALGSLLEHEAAARGLQITSDAGDQHGVLATMIEEIQMWGFEIVQAGNIKGFLDRSATPESIHEEAAKRNLSDVQCCAYTDGSKLSVEMALVGNAFGLTPVTEGMTGPAVAHVSEVMAGAFDFDSYGSRGRIDYILGAEPGPGVYVVGRCDEPVQRPYLSYYKLGEGPYYLFYRPYHLCHIETPRAVARLVLYDEPTLAQRAGRLNDVFARAKRELAPGDEFGHGIGGAEAYGTVAEAAPADAGGRVPLAALEPEGGQRAEVRRGVQRDAPLTWDDVLLPSSDLTRLYAEQFRTTGTGPDIPSSAIAS